MPIDLRSVARVAIDPLLPAGAELRAAADAVALWDHAEMPIARSALIDAVGETGAVRALAVAGNYGMMNRVLDAIGNPIDPQMAAMAAELEVDYWRTDLQRLH